MKLETQTMLTHIHRRTDVRLHRGGVIGRRDFLRGVSAASLAAGTLSWTDAIAASGDQLRERGMACILLWMAGGPSQFETFSPLPDHENGGETKAINTTVSGIQIADNMPHCAKVMQDLAIIRSMASKEGNHARASFLLHHGAIPTASVKYPTLGSVVAKEIGDQAFELPSHVRIGGRVLNAGDGGFFGVDYDPFLLQNPSRPPNNTSPTSSDDRYARRLDLLNRLEKDFGAVEGADIVADHQKLVAKSARMIRSPQMTTFDLSQESESVREAYGGSNFGAGCLLARRLVEAGTTFVEVVSTGWDTHDDNFEKCRDLTNSVDKPTAQLITELKERGMLDRTLVLWMGEFGRTPKINARGGRDHFPRAFNVALAGGGVRGGQVIGKTNKSGMEIADRPVHVADLFRTVYTALGIDADQENESNVGRPIKVVDGGEVVRELLG